MIDIDGDDFDEHAFLREVAAENAAVGQEDVVESVLYRAIRESQKSKPLAEVSRWSLPCVNPKSSLALNCSNDERKKRNCS